MPNNKASLERARKKKNDEYYTLLSDIEKECSKYKSQGINKTIIMPCDDPELIILLKNQYPPENRASQFWVYFHKNFKHLKLKKIIATHFNEKGKFYLIEYSGGDDNNINEFKSKNLDSNGDFRSLEIQDIINEADIVVTNPPFSLFREFVNQVIIKQKKQLLVIGNKNAFTYREIFQLIQDDKVWIGYTQPKNFLVVNGQGTPVITNNVQGLTRWFTNLKVEKRHTNLELYKNYSKDQYPKFDNYNAINVNLVSQIPCDYSGVMGVPVTFIDQYNPQQFKIIDALGRYLLMEGKTDESSGKYLTEINGERMYTRLLIQRRQNGNK